MTAPADLLLRAFPGPEESRHYTSWAMDMECVICDVQWVYDTGGKHCWLCGKFGAYRKTLAGGGR